MRKHILTQKLFAIHITLAASLLWITSVKAIEQPQNEKLKVAAKDVLNSHQQNQIITLAPQSTPLKVDVLLTEQKKPESPYWPLSPGTAAFLTLVASSIVAIFVFFARAKHEKEMRKIEADANIREKVYLEAAEAFAWAMNNLSKLFSAKPDEYFDSMNDPKMTSSIYKINLVAKDATLEKVSKFGTIFGQTSLALAAKSVRIQLFDQKAERLTERIKENLDHQNQLINQWKEVAEFDRTPELKQAFSENFSTAQRLFYEMDNARSECWKLVMEERFELTLEGLAKMKEIGCAMNEVSIAVREEMELPIDSNAFRARTEAAFHEIEKSILEFRDNLEKNYNEIGS